MSAFRRLAWSAAAATLALIALGGVVRVTGSGMGCGDDWPLCHGRILPPLDLPTLIEYSHRLVAVLVSGLVASLALMSVVQYRRHPVLRAPFMWAVALLALQVLVGAAAVKLALPPATVVVHLAIAMTLLAVLVAAAVRATERGARPPRSEVPAGASPEVVPTSFRRLIRVSTLTAFLTILLGGLVANFNAASACTGFPLCNDALLPAGSWPARLQAVHRLAAFSLVALLLATCWKSRLRNGHRKPPALLARLAAAALGLGLLQTGIAAAMVLGSLRPEWRAAHMVVGTLIWATLVWLDASTRSVSTPSRSRLTTGVSRPAEKSLAWTSLTESST
jgi:cytochrome c oxidase assembly protein subunit 15